MKKPEIEFPCDYPIKVIGKVHSAFRETTLDIISRYDSTLDESRVETRNSTKGNYISLTVWIMATGKPQLEGIFEDLKASGLVSLVL